MSILAQLQRTIREQREELGRRQRNIETLRTQILRKDKLLGEIERERDQIKERLAKYENPRSHESHLVRGTSRVAWSRLVTSGRVDSDAARIYRLIRDHGPITDREGCEQLGITDPNEYRPTRNRLMNRGLIEEYERRRCKVSGNTVIAWNAVPEVR
jgi:transcription initiation factor IIE alpha subunit